MNTWKAKTNVLLFRVCQPVPSKHQLRLRKEWSHANVSLLKPKCTKTVLSINAENRHIPYYLLLKIVNPEDSFGAQLKLDQYEKHLDREAVL